MSNDKIQEKLYNKTTIAKLLNVSRTYINKMSSQNKLTFNKDGLISEEDARLQLKNNSDPGKKSKVNTDNNDNNNNDLNDLNDLNYNQIKTEKEKYLTLIAKLDYEKQKGDLVEKNQISSESFRIAKLLQDKILNLPEALSDILAAESDPKKVYTLLNNNILIILNEIVKELEKYSKES